MYSRAGTPVPLLVCLLAATSFERSSRSTAESAINARTRDEPTCDSFVQLIWRAEAISKACCSQPGACERITSSFSLPVAGAACVDAQCATLVVAFWDDCQTASRAMGVDWAGLDEFHSSCRKFLAQPRTLTTDERRGLHPKPEPMRAPRHDARHCSPEQRATCENRSNAPDESDTVYFAAHVSRSNRRDPPFKPPRLSSITTEQFAKFSAAGWPIIVTDVSRDWPMQNWTCESIGKQFPGRRMRAEYMADIWSPLPDINNQLLGDVETWTSMNLSSDTYDPRFAKAAPRYAPFYWAVKDSEEHGEADLLEQIRHLTRKAYFMEPASLREMEITPEFWFSAPGAGAKAHIDPHCESSLSVQLSGTKTWRLSPMLNPTDFTPEFADGAVYTKAFVDRHFDGKAWKPMFEFTLHPGEGLFFPPGFMHETKNVGEGCAASITYQYEVPFPARYFRKFMSRVYRSVSLDECHATLGDIATLFQLSTTVAKTMLESGDRDAACLGAHDLGSGVDTDGNGVISLAEINGTLTKGWQHGKNLIRDTDVLTFHDLNDDGTLTKTELVKSIHAYAVESANARDHSTAEDL